MTNAHSILESVTVAPNVPNYQLYRWGDYVELRCLTHKDKRFSRDNLAEARGESGDLNNNSGDACDSMSEEFDLDDFAEVELIGQELELDQDETLTGNTFRLLQWRAAIFGDDWPFIIDRAGIEIKLREKLNAKHYLYLQLLLSALLRYCPNIYRKIYTKAFEDLSFHVFRNLLPKNAEAYQFGAAHSTRYTGKLFHRLAKLAKDIRGSFGLVEQDFPKNDVGDGGLDLVAWHPLGDERDNIPISFAQCGCTADGWPSKMLEASPSRLNNLHVGHPWATYYFMPLDLCEPRGNKMHWAECRHFSQSIVIDRLRIVRLANEVELDGDGIIVRKAINEVLQLKLT